MNKKLKFLAFVPIYGLCIMLVYLFFLALGGKISKKRYLKTFLICAIISIVCYVIVYLILYVINKCFSMAFLLENKGILLILIAGYMMNIFSFMFINKKQEYIFSSDKTETSKK